MLFIVPLVLQDSTGYLIAFLMFILTLLLYKHLAHKEAPADSSSFVRFKSSFVKFVPFLRIDIAILLTYATAVIAVVIIPPDCSLYLDWSNVPFLNWLRLIAGFLLTSFLPGYVILKIIDTKEEIKGTASLVFSFLLSFFIIVLLSLALELTGNKISQYGFPLLLIANIVLLILFLISNFWRNKSKVSNISSKDSKFKKNYLPALILLCLVGLQCLLLYSVFFTSQSFLRGDFWSHFADASNLLKYGFETQSTLSGYFWGYRIFNVAFFVLAGFPLINAEIMLVFLYPISILAFYSMDLSLCNLWF